MKLLGARLTPFRLPLREPLLTGHGPIASRDGVLLELLGEGGHVGLGEASPIGGFGMESPQEAEHGLEAVMRALLAAPATGEGAVLDRLDGLPQALLAGRPAVRFGLQAALADLEAQRLDCGLSELLAGGAARPTKTCVEVNALVRGGDAADLEVSAAAGLAAGFRTFKLKLGGRPVEMDLARARALRTCIGSEARLRLDANGAWSEEEARRALAGLAELDPEYVEQPLRAGDVAGLTRLRAASSVPIALDEGAVGDAEVRSIIASRTADFVILKPSALGGLDRAVRLAERARDAGIGVVVTSLIDSTVGVLAAAALAASLPGEELAHGLATSELLALDVALPPVVESGRLMLPRKSGLGLRPDPDRLAAVQRGRVVELEA